MKPRFTEKTKQFVANRAEYRCEYCKMPSEYTMLRFHVEHIRSLKHRGSSDLTNLAWACSVCNQHKGPDIATYAKDDVTIVRLYHPRTDIWSEHFRLLPDGIITALTEIGDGTIQLLWMNKEEVVTQRRILLEAALF